MSICLIIRESITTISSKNVGTQNNSWNREKTSQKSNLKAWEKSGGLIYLQDIKDIGYNETCSVLNIGIKLWHGLLLSSKPTSFLLYSTKAVHIFFDTFTRVVRYIMCIIRYLKSTWFKYWNEHYYLSKYSPRFEIRNLYIWINF